MLALHYVLSVQQGTCQALHLRNANPVQQAEQAKDLRQNVRFVLLGQANLMRDEQRVHSVLKEASRQLDLKNVINVCQAQQAKSRLLNV
jgi:hypothetical protein